MRSVVWRIRGWTLVLVVSAVLLLGGFAAWRASWVWPMGWTVDRVEYVQGKSNIQWWYVATVCGRIDVGWYAWDVDQPRDARRRDGWYSQFQSQLPSKRVPLRMYSRVSNPSNSTRPAETLWEIMGVRWSYPDPIWGRPRSTFQQFRWALGLHYLHWSLLWSAVTAIAWWRRRAWGRRLNRLQGMCDQCGYDLRASPDRCPECGTSSNLSPNPRPPLVPLTVVDRRQRQPCRRLRGGQCRVGPPVEFGAVG